MESQLELTKSVQTTRTQVYEVSQCESRSFQIIIDYCTRLRSQLIATSGASNEWNSDRNIRYWYAQFFEIGDIKLETILGTAILLKPGIIAGGSVTHDCPVSRSIGYFLEPVVMLAPFAKKPLSLTLRGITSDDRDLSVCPVARQ